MALKTVLLAGDGASSGHAAAPLRTGSTEGTDSRQALAMKDVNPKFGGLTDDQVLQVLQSIAIQASVAAKVCRAAAAELGREDGAYTLHAVDNMICAMGALADLGTGYTVIGDFPTWMAGPNFHAEKG